jgi:glycosyltransferase involved in cell wall biosynthesis
MRIVFDGTTLCPGRTGVGYYSEHLLHHLAHEALGDELIVMSNRPLDTTRALPDRVRIVAASWRMPRMVWMQTLAPRLLRQLKPEVVHFTNGIVPLASPVPTVVTIHDMSLTMYPRHHPLRRVLLNRPLVDIAARNATAVITVSEAAKRDIVRLYRLAPERVHVIHEAAAPAFRPIHDLAELDRVRRRYSLADRFILYVGTIEPRKNLPKLIDAFAERRTAGDLPHQLVCVGPYGWLCRDIEKRIERQHIEDAVRFTGYVPFDDLPALYNLAEMFVFPSLYEGFGLPVIEAMASGVPVITGHVGALTEVGGGAIEHVDRLDSEALGEAMVKLARSRDRRDELTRLGLQRARAFSWTQAALKTLAVYRQAIRGTADLPVPLAEFAPLESAASIVGGRSAIRESQQPIVQ